jgi:hypothetical protein
MPSGNKDVTEEAILHGNEFDAQITIRAAVEDKTYNVSWRYNIKRSQP